LNRHIIHLYIPAFPIAVERVREPRLRDRPVVVAPLRRDRGLVLCASPEARREGVFKGMRLRRALEYCPGLVVLPPNPALVETAYGALTRMAACYTPLWEPYRAGHVYLDVTGTDRLWGRAKDTAWRLRKEVKDRLSLPGVAGVSGNKMVSSIASRVMGREGVMDVDHGKESSFMAPLKVDVLPGIGHVRKRLLLEELNITLVREIAALDMGTLGLLFGRSAYVIHQRSLGIDPTPVYPPARKPRVSEETTLPEDENDDGRLLGVLYGMVERCSRRLRTRALLPRRAGLRLRYTDGEEVLREIFLPRKSGWDSALYPPLERLFFKLCRRRVRVRFLQVWFRDLSPRNTQLSLFPEMDPAPEKEKNLTRALDRIREKYGDLAVRYGRTAG